MTSRLYPHTCNVKRGQAVGTNGRYSKAVIHTDLACLFTPMSSQVEIQNGFEPGRGWDVYFQDTATDIKTGDQLVYNGQSFNVSAVRSYDVPRVGHLHCQVSQEIA